MAHSEDHLHRGNASFVPMFTMMIKVSIIASFPALGLEWPLPAYLTPTDPIPASAFWPVLASPSPSWNGGLHSSHYIPHKHGNSVYLFIPVDYELQEAVAYLPLHPWHQALWRCPKLLSTGRVRQLGCLVFRSILKVAGKTIFLSFWVAYDEFIF